MATNKVDYARKLGFTLQRVEPILARIIAQVGALGIQRAASASRRWRAR